VAPETTFELGGCKSTPLKKGVVVKRGGFLEPICSLEVHPSYQSEAKLFFGFDEDDALFSAV
jgi:hypothetical protein